MFFFARLVNRSVLPLGLLLVQHPTYGCTQSCLLSANYAEMTGVAKEHECHFGRFNLQRDTLNGLVDTQDRNCTLEMFCNRQCVASKQLLCFSSLWRTDNRRC
ncbi:hypothetical protein F4808DRAFT_435689 [Astrocystis sublimbata]|nr:hypothetical protein F4808DRAFT_435689 [Astrocystis sublimbata]